MRLIVRWLSSPLVTIAPTGVTDFVNTKSAREDFGASEKGFDQAGQVYVRP
jgi:hypothetical protein